MLKRELSIDLAYDEVVRDLRLIVRSRPGFNQWEERVKRAPLNHHIKEEDIPMAKKVTALIKLQVNAGKATPAPPIGPALGQHGVNIPGFCKEFNDRTAKRGRPDHSRL